METDGQIDLGRQCLKQIWENYMKMSIFLTPADGGGNNNAKFQKKWDGDYG